MSHPDIRGRRARPLRRSPLGARLAWLIYTERERNARSRVLVVGPKRSFMEYVSHVLPALIAEREQGLRESYVALTRPTTTPVVGHARPLPGELQLS